VNEGKRRSNPYDIPFYVLAFFFACGAVFHIAAILQPNLDIESPAWRHGLFVGINIACVVGFLKRPLFFLPLFCVLVVQQVSSHGRLALHAWQSERAFDVKSIGVILVMPITVVFLVADALRKRSLR
jgi:hypothetical protein